MIEAIRGRCYKPFIEFSFHLPVLCVHSPCSQVVVVPLRVNVNLKAVTVEDLVARRKVRL